MWKLPINNPSYRRTRPPRVTITRRYFTISWRRAAALSSAEIFAGNKTKATCK